MIRLKTLIFVVALVFITGAAGAEPLTFAVIQPGQPGSTADAQPVMDQLAAYLGQKTGLEVKAVYHNALEPSLEMLRADKPALAIVTLPVYAAYARLLAMIPVAQTMPGGETGEVYRLVTAKDGPDDWTKLSGKVCTTLAFPPVSAQCLAFGKSPEGMPFTLAGTFRPLSCLRKAARGKVAGALLDGVQYAALGSMREAGKVKVVHESRELPTSPVVAFGQLTAPAQKLSAALLAMGSDSGAADLLKLLRTSGFSAPSPALKNLAMEASDGPCPD